MILSTAVAVGTSMPRIEQAIKRALAPRRQVPNARVALQQTSASAAPAA
jgi:hypothetical protein